MIEKIKIVENRSRRSKNCIRSFRKKETAENKKLAKEECETFPDVKKVKLNNRPPEKKVERIKGLQTRHNHCEFLEYKRMRASGPRNGKKQLTYKGVGRRLAHILY